MKKEVGYLTYSAKNIGRETVRLSVANKCWISNLKLQKLLYFSWLRYYHETNGKHLFDEEFQAWRYGPVVPSVYYDFWDNAGNILIFPKKPTVEIDKAVSDFLLKMLKEYDSASVDTMVNESHASVPWKKNYVERRKETIPISDMEGEASRLKI